MSAHDDLINTKNQDTDIENIDENLNYKGKKRGRKKGGYDIRRKYREMFDHDTPEIVRKALDMAKEGDVRAMKIVFDRIAPPLKYCLEDYLDENVDINMEKITSLQEINTFAERVLTYTQHGKLPIPHAESLIKIAKDKFEMALKLKNIELTEDRITFLEEKLGIFKHEA